MKDLDSKSKKHKKVKLIKDHKRTSSQQKSNNVELCSDEEGNRLMKKKHKIFTQQTSSQQQSNIESCSVDEKDRPLKKKHKVFVQQTLSQQQSNLDSCSDEEEDRPLKKKHKVFTQRTLSQRVGYLELCSDHEDEGSLSQEAIDLDNGFDTVTRLHKKKRKHKKIECDASEVCSAYLMSEFVLKDGVGVLNSSSRCSPQKNRRRTESTATIADDLISEQFERSGDFQSILDELSGDTSVVSSVKSKNKNRSRRQSETLFAVISPKSQMTADESEALSTDVNSLNERKSISCVKAEHTTPTKLMKEKQYASTSRTSTGTECVEHSPTQKKIQGCLTSHQKKQQNHEDHLELRDCNVENSASNNVYFSADFAENSPERSDGSLRSDSKLKMRMKLSESMNAELGTATDETIQKKKKKRTASSNSISHREYELGSTHSRSKTKSMNNNMPGSMANGRKKQLDHDEHLQFGPYSDSDVENGVSDSVFFSAESSQEVLNGSLRNVSNSKVNVNTEELCESGIAERITDVDKIQRKTKRKRIASSGSVSQNELEFGSSPSTSQDKVIICRVSGNSPNRPHKKKQRNIESQNDVTMSDIFTDSLISSIKSADIVEGTSKNKKSFKVGSKRKQQAVTMIVDNAVSSQLVDSNEAAVEINDDNLRSDTPSLADRVQRKGEKRRMDRLPASQNTNRVLPRGVDITGCVQVNAVAGNGDEMESYDLKELHKYNNLCYLKSKDDVISSGLRCKTGRWCRAEDRQLDNNWKEIIEGFDLCPPHCLLMSNFADVDIKKQIKQFIIDNDFYVRLARKIPRTLYCVYTRARRRFHPGNKGGKFSEEDKDILFELQKKFGCEWQKIGNEMGRSGEACRNVFRLGIPNSKYGSWTEEEDENLTQAVNKYRRESGAGIFDPMPWSKIARKVGTRNWNQCMHHWMTKVTQPDEKMTLEKKVKLMTIIKECLGNATTASEINWREIWETHFGSCVSSPFILKERFHYMRRAYLPKHYKHSSLHECVAYMVDVVCPYLVKSRSTP